MKTLILIIILIPSACFAAFTLPTNLNKEQRIELAHILGVNTSSKLLTNPFSLGGYSGVELAVTIEKISLDEYDFGSFTSDDLSFARFSIGKGLYHNLDIFIEFVPPLRQDLISQYGLLLKWGFYETHFFPLTFSLSMHTNTTIIDDSVSSSSTGAEVTVGVSIYDVAFYLGLGQVKSVSAFTGSKNSINFTDTGASIKETIEQSHTLVGALYQWQQYFLVFQIDRYKDPIYTTKLGLRF